MPFKVICARRARNIPIDCIFKMKRSLRDMRANQQCLEGDFMELGDNAQASLDGDILYQFREETQREVNDFSDEDDSDGSVMTTPSASSGSSSDGSSAESEIKENNVFQGRTFNVKHPWNIVDYHLYLSTVERGRDTYMRRNSMYLYDGQDCRPIFYDEFFNDETFDPYIVGYKPQLLFSILPISEPNISFSGRHYVLGFDWSNKTLFARHFDWMPDDVGDAWAVWDHGWDVYTITIPKLYQLLKTCFSERNRKVNMGILSSSPYCNNHRLSSDDPGMEIVIAILFSQFVVDFVEAIFVQERKHIDKFKHELNYYMDESRLVLQRASYRAWFAVREGMTKQEYTHKLSFNQFINDLYTFSKSTESGSLCDRSWHAPGLDTCNMIRQQDRNQRRQETERRLEDLFNIPNDEVLPESPGAMFERMLARTDENQAAVALYSPGAPRTPSPPFRYREIPQQRWSPGSPGVVRPAVEEHDGFEATECHKISLPLLLKRTLDLVEARPELDTFDNRGRFGTLLTDIGIYVERRPMDDFAIAPTFGYENDSWKLGMRSLAEPAAPVPRRLLPSPLID